MYQRRKIVNRILSWNSFYVAIFLFILLAGSQITKFINFHVEIANSEPFQKQEKKMYMVF